MKKGNFVIGFMLFALFFGAGNLIYPPILGMESGTSYFAAISGFVITGVGLPLLAVTAISFVKNDARELADRVHPLFGLLFTSVVYLAIGPFFGIPRAATVGYEMSLEPFQSGELPLFLFTTIFFILVFLFSLNPSKVVDQIGKYLTPLLLLVITALILGGFLLLKTPLGSPNPNYRANPFFNGFVEGYLTMDAIAALAFGIIVVNAYRERGVHTNKAIVKETLKSGLITGVGLVAVYGSIGWIGARMASYGPFENGGDLLSFAADTILGTYGVILLGIIVTLACFTTSVGLVVACGQFFAKVTMLSYKWVIFIVTMASYIIANQGLNTILDFSVPVLVFIYPIAIVLILLTFLNKAFQGSRYVYRFAILFTALVSLYDGLSEFGFSLNRITPYVEKLPFFEIGLGWVVPAIIGFLIGLLYRAIKEPNN
ncbi:branched-chain amino acid transport system II carrier protein [Oceanobacillus kapialis]|uniref:Branched-chain amino acid transport system carrier protein n=1 Tax=Oceanobacillus kapialis TaxID=481353 RepID=A0ABW5Q1L7_9BACI